MISAATRRLYKRVWERYLELQYIMYFQETAELQFELTEELRGQGRKGKIQEEIADVMILCEQLAVRYGEAEVARWKKYKLSKLAKLVGG